jgi:hypothetical protein
MNTTGKRGAFGRTWAWTLLLPLLLAGMAVGEAYRMHGRISFDAGGTMVRGEESDDWSQATVNTLILAGDTLWVDEGGTGEVELSGGIFLRIADGSKAEVKALPPSTTVQGWVGSFYVQRLSRSTGGFVLRTPAALVEVEEDSCVRIDVLEDGVTTVTARWGGAQVLAEGGDGVSVGAGERTWVEPGLLPALAQPFDRMAEDAFDAWNRERAEVLAEGMRTIPQEMPLSKSTIGGAELAATGEWVHVDSRRYWRPTVVTEFVPYRHGYWSWTPGCGHVWVGHYPFSYITTHHGRWHYTASYGWVWDYDPVWSPAWVASVRCGDYFMWTPVDYHYRPVVVSSAAAFTLGGVRFCVSSTSYAPAANLYGGSWHVGSCTPAVVRHVHSYRDNFTVWNLHPRRVNPIRVPYQSTVTLVRNYTPSRTIRGVSMYSSGGVRAVERVHRLEASTRYASFNRAVRQSGDGRAIRTGTAGKSTAARVRRASIDTRHSKAISEYTRAARANVERNSATVRAASKDTSRRGADSDARLSGIRESGSSRSLRGEGRENASVASRTARIEPSGVRRSTKPASANGNTASARKPASLNDSRSSRVNMATLDMESAPQRTAPRSSIRGGGRTPSNTPERDSKPGVTPRTAAPQSGVRTESGSSDSRSYRSYKVPPRQSRTTPPSSGSSMTTPRSTVRSAPSSPSSRTTAPRSTIRSAPSSPSSRTTVPRSTIRSAPSSPSSRTTVPRSTIRSAPSSSSSSIRSTAPQYSKPRQSQPKPSSSRYTAPSIRQPSSSGTSRSGSTRITPSAKPSFTPSVKPSVRSSSSSSRYSVPAPSSPRSGISGSPVSPRSSSSSSPSRISRPSSSGTSGRASSGFSRPSSRSSRSRR